MNANIPKQVKLFEVGPRDGLQNESSFVPTDIKVQWINQLIDAGLPEIEITSFASPKWVPALSDHTEIMQKFKNTNTPCYALIPNEKGLQNAIDSGCKYFSLITAASETFTKKNTNCTIDESLTRIKNITNITKKNNHTVRAYISCTLGCPYEGFIQPKKTAIIAKQLLDIGCDEIVISDTIGTGTPNQTQSLIEAVSKFVPIKQLAIHFHDTYGQALANIYSALQMGIAKIDASSAGLGGCPYAKGASGNVAMEDVIYLLHGMGIETGINLDKIVQASEFIMHHFAQTTRSKTAQALLSKCKKN